MSTKRKTLAQQQQQQQQQHPHQHLYQQRLYGSDKQLKQLAQHYSIDHPSGSNTFDRTTANSCLLQMQHPLQHSQSITALPSMDLYGSYSTLPMTAASGISGAPAAAAARAACTLCKRHWCNNMRWYTAASQPDDACCLYSLQQQQQQQQQQRQTTQLPPPPPACICGNAGINSYQHYGNQPQTFGNGCYFGYEHGNHITEEEDSAFPVLPDREFHMLHRNIPALRRTGVDTTAIRQYFYPDGGWGWIICGVSFLVHILTTGLQLSYGLILYYAIRHLNTISGIEWLGALSWSISMVVSPFVVTFCRKKSTRLLAVVGGLVLPLGILFTSFANELSQIIFSYGVVFGIGVAMVRESSTIMLGNYFKRRRQFVEMVAMSGEGVGIALFSVILKEGVGKAGWRYGLQIIAALVASSFFMALLYRPASLYHPQRRAIQHLKNQRKKMRENKLTPSMTEPKVTKYFFLDITSLKSATVRILLMINAVAALGIYTPMFSISANAIKEGSDIQDLVLLQTFLGMSTVLGVVIAGALVRRPFRIAGRFLVTTQVVSQVFISTVALAILFLSFVMGYRGLCILSWIYGIGFGGFRYSLKMLAFERIKLKQFTKAWGLIRGIESIPVLISVPLTSFLNDYSLKYGRAGYYICSAAAAIAGIIIFFISYSNLQQTTGTTSTSAATAAAASNTNRKHVALNGGIPTMRASAGVHNCKTDFGAPLMSDYIYNGCDYPTPDLLNRSCISLNQVENDLSYQRSNYCHSRPRPMMPTCYYHPQQQQQRLPQPHQSVACDVHGTDLGRARRRLDDVTGSDMHRQQYHFGQGSIGARAGKRLQKSHSFMQSPYTGQRHHHHHHQPPQHQHAYSTQQWYCNCHGNATNYHWSQRDLRSDVSMQPLLCTCDTGSPTSACIHNSRSRSVPEGLSSMSQQCNCKSMTMLPSREIIYLPRTTSQSHVDFRCQQHEAKEFFQQSQLPQQEQRFVAATTPRYRQKRSQSLSKPIHFVEQITTSV